MQGKRQNQRPMDDFPVYPDMREEGGGIIQEYAPFVFGGVMLIAAFAFAGNYMGQNASARNLTPDEQALVSPVTNIIAKGSLLPGRCRHFLRAYRDTRENRPSAFDFGVFPANPLVLLMVQ